jgi:hypothetical protein
MGFRAASGTKPSMLSKKVPGADQAEAVEKQVTESTPKEKIQTAPKPQQTQPEPSILDFQADMGSVEQPQMTDMPQEPVMETQAPQVDQIAPEMSILDFEIPTGKAQDPIKDPAVKNYLFDLQNNNIPFDGSVYGIKFKRDKDGQYYYYQPESFKGEFRTRGKLSKEFGEPEVEQREVQKAGWRKVEDLDPATRKMLHITSSIMLDEPAIATALATGLAAGSVTGGMGFFPALLTEMAVGGIGGYGGSGIAEQRYQEKLKDPEESKKLAFLEAALGSAPKPTGQLMSTLLGVGGGLIPAGMIGAAKGYDAASKVFASKAAQLKPILGNALKEIGDFAEKIGSRLDARDIVRQVDPNLETKIGLIEGGELGETAQQGIITQTQSKMVKLKGFLQAMKDKFAPGTEALSEGVGEVGKRTAKQIEESPFSTQVILPREDMNLAEVIQENQARTLKANSAQARELAGDLKFDPTQLITQVEGILGKSFGTFKQMMESGQYTPAQLLEQFKLTNPEAASAFVQFYNNLKTLTARVPSALGQPSDAVFVDSVFNALPAERFESKVVQEQLVTMRHPIEPAPIGGGPEYVGEAFPFMDQPDRFHSFVRPQYTDPTTGKIMYGRGDLPKRNYYVLGGPRGQPGAPMSQIGQATPYGTRIPGGPSGVVGEGAGQVQESLFGGTVGSAAGPRMIETPAKRFLGPKAGGENYSGLTFDQINELNQSAQNIVESLSRSQLQNKNIMGAASEIARTTRQFEDDAMFKLAAIRGKEGFAEKLIADKATFANSAKDLAELSTFVSKNLDTMSGQVLKLQPQQLKRFLKYLNEQQINELRGLVLNRAYTDSVTDLLEAGVHVKVNPEKIVTRMLTQPESRANIKTLFGAEALKDLDSFAKMAKVVNSSGQYTASTKTIAKATSRLARWLPGGESLNDFLGAFFMGNPTAEQVIATTLKNSEALLRKPSGGLIGKMGKAAASFRDVTGSAGQMGVSAGTKMLPAAVKAYPPGYKDTREMTLGEFD